MPSSAPTITAAAPPGPAPTSAPPPLPRAVLTPPPITSSPKFSTRVGAGSGSGSGSGFDAAQFGTADTGADFIPGTHETAIRTPVAPNGVSAKASAPASQPATTTTPNLNLQQRHIGAPPTTRTAPYFHPRTSSLLPPPNPIVPNRQPFLASDVSNAALPLTHHQELQQQPQPNTTRPPYYHHPRPRPHPPPPQHQPQPPVPRQGQQQQQLQEQYRQTWNNDEELFFHDNSRLNDVALVPTAKAYLSPPPDDADDFATTLLSPSLLVSDLLHAPQLRSSSAAAIDDENRLNRWSLSSSTSTRRQSIDTVALHAQVSAQYQSLVSAARLTGSPSRKLQKKTKPPTSPGLSRVRRSSPTPVSIPVPPLTSLPPIVSLPSLEAEVSTPRASSAADAYPPRRDSLLIKPYENSDPRFASTIARNNNHADEPASNGRRTSAVEMMYVERNGGGMPQQPQQSPPHQKGHSRSHSHTNGSSDTLTSRGSKDRSSKQPSQKAMLSQALEKANAAVQLDNSRNFVAARLAYSEACDLLHQVLMRTNGEDDRKKLEAISKTYTTRIEELDDILPKEKATPPRRPSRSQNDGLFGVPNDTDDESAMMSTASSGYSKTSSHRREPSGSRPANNMPANPTKFGSFSSSQFSPQSAYQPPQKQLSNASDVGLMPPPLSPRRPPSPGRQAGMATPDAPFRADFSMAATRLAPPSQSDDNGYARGHNRANSHESVSWLDPIDESGGSNAPSSNHSRSSSMGIRRRHLRTRSGGTEAEFDAALDDAIEAAYDDSYDVVDDKKSRDEGEDVVARALRRVELAKERVRESEREALQLANDREKRLREQLQAEDDEEPSDFLDANDSDEEERILEEMTKGYVIEDFSFGPGSRTRPSIPRASDSSEGTSRTWHTSTGSNPQTASTTLTTVSEGARLSNGDRPKTSQAPLPPPTQALPQLPLQRPGSSGSRLSEVKANDSVRNRRLSGQNPKQLKIETSRNPAVTGPSTGGTMYIAETPPIAQAPPLPKTAGYIAQQRQALNAGAARYKQTPSPTPPVPLTQENDTSKQPGLRKNYSSSSLKSMNQRGRNLSVAGLEETDMSPGTPLSNQFGSAVQRPAVPNLPTPIAAAFKDRITSGGTGGLYLFDGAINDGHISPADSPTSAVTAGGIPDAPVPLEPCPKGTMLRPFWLMRCLFQTLAHPRGGYLSNKLFVPRDVWKVKGVKLKNVEDKISNCDLLTAALQKLGRVDTCDADAMLEEMQSLESIFEQVQANLTRRLGNSEVGVQSMAALFRDGANGSAAGAGGNLDPESAGSVPRSASVTGKSSFSWRRLRSKNSTPGLNAGPGGYRKESPATMMMDSAYGNNGGGSGINGVSSLPMTSQPTSRPSKRDLSAVQFTGPNAGYMASLAKLFDAAQAIDQIARQVEDPGLRHADKTQVGLELCTRHAAEFFAFYICRFVLTDLTILLDKFVKRGSEWVLV
ncbi:hypothetical protein MCOR28_011175 [Pyricularia oryzae]|nr:hypothetical protein MCOR26_001136 [Pyricularia oryzae]KAI6331816.1 hypothetical protein MCOR28_011175 [Pyricularia oryzae]